MSTYEEALKRWRKKGKPLGPAPSRVRIPPLVIKAQVVCPECGEPFPVRLRLLQMTWAVDHPMKKPRTKQQKRNS